MDYIAQFRVMKKVQIGNGSGNEPSSVALLKPATNASLLYCNFENFT